jgi:hypothetical protein
VHAKDEDGVTALDRTTSPPEGKTQAKAEVLRAAGGKLGEALP